MSRSLTPGWASGPPIVLSPPLPRSSSPKFPPHTRLGLLELVTAKRSPIESAPIPPGSIAVISSLTAADVLSLIQHTVAGVILCSPTLSITRHAVVAARAVGLPVAWVPEFSPPPHPILLDTTTTTPRVSRLSRSSAPSTAQRASPASDISRVVPLSIAHQHQLPWLELATGQAEERLLAQRILTQQRVLGVGLLRIEFLTLAAPELDEQGLFHHLCQLFSELHPHTVCVRLSDWAHDKRPPTNGPFSFWNGRRGLDGISRSSSLSAQIDALLRAQDTTQHPSLKIIAPHVGDTDALIELAARVGAAQCIAMLESPEALANFERYLPHVCGFWIGQGDLSDKMTPQQIIEASASIRARAPSHLIALCGEPSAL